MAVVAVFQHVGPAPVRDQQRRWLPPPGQTLVHGVDFDVPLLHRHGNAHVLVVRAGQGVQVVQRKADGPGEGGATEGELCGQLLVVAPRARQERRDPLGQTAGITGPCRRLDRVGVVDRLRVLDAHRATFDDMAAASDASDAVRSYSASWCRPSGSITNGRRPARRAPTTSMAGMSPTYQRRRIEPQQVQRGVEDARVGLHHPDVARVDDELDGHAHAGAHLADLERRQALGHQTVGVGHDPQPHAGVRQRLQPVPGPLDRLDPQRRVGELAVDVPCASSRRAWSTSHAST